MNISPSLEVNLALTYAFDYLNNRLFNGELERPMLYFSRNDERIGGFFTANSWTDKNKKTVNEIGLNANHFDAGNIMHIINILIHEMIHQCQFANDVSPKANDHNKFWVDTAKSIGLEIVKSKEEPGNSKLYSTLPRPHGKAHIAMTEMPLDIILPLITQNLGSPDPDSPQDGGMGETGAGQQGEGSEGEGQSGSGSEEGGQGQDGQGQGMFATVDPSKMTEEQLREFYKAIYQGQKDAEQRREQLPEKETKQGQRIKYTCVICGTNLWGKASLRVMCMECGQELIESSK